MVSSRPEVDLRSSPHCRDQRIHLWRRKAAGSRDGASFLLSISGAQPMIALAVAVAMLPDGRDSGFCAQLGWGEHFFAF